MEQAPNPSIGWHIRMQAITGILTLIDLSMVVYAAQYTVTRGPTMMIIFGFEVRGVPLSIHEALDSSSFQSTPYYFRLYYAHLSNTCFILTTYEESGPGKRNQCTYSM